MTPQLEIPELVKQYPMLFMAQTTRYGGTSWGPYASLNLGLHTEDDRDTVLENRARLWRFLGTEEGGVAGGHQVHGDLVKRVNAPGYYNGYDAFITNVPGIFLTVTIADCVPILIFDPVRNVIAAIHAGWRGTVADISGKTMQKMMEDYGSQPKDCVAYIGVCIDFDQFEVGEEVAQHFDPSLKKEVGEKFKVNLKEANRRQLTRAGIRSEAIEVSPYCTFRDSDRFFSHRKEGGITGRMLAIVGMKEH